MDDSKIIELRKIHRDLAVYLGKQHEAVSNCLLTVVALRKSVEIRTDLREVYTATVRELSEDETFQAGLGSSSTLESLLQRLADW